MEDLSNISKVGLGALGAGTMGAGTVLAIKKTFEYMAGVSLSDIQKAIKQREELIMLIESMAAKEPQT